MCVGGACGRSCVAHQCSHYRLYGRLPLQHTNLHADKAATVSREIAEMATPGDAQKKKKASALRPPLRTGLLQAQPAAVPLPPPPLASPVLLTAFLPPKPVHDP